MCKFNQLLESASEIHSAFSPGDILFLSLGPILLFNESETQDRLTHLYCFSLARASIATQRNAAQIRNREHQTERVPPIHLQSSLRTETSLRLPARVREESPETEFTCSGWGLAAAFAAGCCGSSARGIQRLRPLERVLNCRLAPPTSSAEGTIW